eukprot:Skav234517  [mRNA]  locus=scaffold2162:214817:223139:- [translate_table: standard]
MVCSRCQVFPGEPLCVPCRTASRIRALLECGDLRPESEERVVLVLRNCVGSLTDLLEADLSCAPGRLVPHHQPKVESASLLSGAAAPVVTAESSPNEEQGGVEEEKPLKEEKAEKSKKRAKGDCASDEKEEEPVKKKKKKESTKAKKKEKKERAIGAESALEEKKPEETKEEEAGEKEALAGSSKDSKKEPAEDKSSDIDRYARENPTEFQKKPVQEKRDQRSKSQRAWKDRYLQPVQRLWHVEMAPKAKVRAKAKAKAKAKAGAKAAAKAKARGGPPAGRGRGRLGARLRRPAAALGHGSGAAPADLDMAMGSIVKFKDVSPLELGQPGRLVVTEGVYYHKPGRVAGVVKGLRLEPPHQFIDLECTGTDIDQLLHYLSGKADKKMRVLVCPAGCSHEIVNEDIMHAMKGRRGLELEKEDGWMGNLIDARPAEPVDELGDLRARADGLGPARPPERPARAEEDEKSSSRKRKKKKKDKSKKGEKDVAAKDDKVAMDGSRAKQAGTKDSALLFAGTGLDPQERVRRKVARRAQRHLAKRHKSKKSTSSSRSGSSSSSSKGESEFQATESIFDQASKVRRIFDQFPGALGSSAVAHMRRSLLQELGEEDVTGALRPVALLYFKQHLARKSQGPALRELHTLSTTIDLLLRGRVASAVDCLGQRLKSIEASMTGTHWSERDRGGKQDEIPVRVPRWPEDRQGLWKDEGQPKRGSIEGKRAIQEGQQRTASKGRQFQEGKLRGEEKSESGATAPVDATLAKFSEIQPTATEERASGTGTLPSSPGSIHPPFPVELTSFDGDGVDSSEPSAAVSAREKVFAPDRMIGKSLVSCGGFLLHRLLEVLPLRSKPTGRMEKMAIFPLPTSRSVLMQFDPMLGELELTWLLCVCLSLNSLWGSLLHHDQAPNGAQATCLQHLVRHVRSFSSVSVPIEHFDWKDFFSVKSIDYKGDEVRVARWFQWGNIEPALPQDVGTVSLVDVCTHGCKAFVEDIGHYLKPPEEWGPLKPPRVMVEDGHWADVCRGLVNRGLCGLIERDDVFSAQGQPLLNGLFGVTKDEYGADGTEIFRLIMNLIPFNNISYAMSGDVNTLPTWSMMTPYFLQPSECLLVSSEDVKCFFYTMKVPCTWWKFLAFNKPVPDSALPSELVGKEVYLMSKVLPMGYLNSVSIAQHVHRNLVLAAHSKEGLTNLPGQELRKDKPFSVAEPLWRVYLDNYDLLERVEKTELVDVQGTLSPAVLALRNQYESWEVPRNVKKSVQRAALCEMQGATVNGLEGVAFPREVKMAKYFTMALHLVTCSDASTTGGGICCSVQTTALGAAVSEGSLRGEHPQLQEDPGVLCIGLFDGIGALRVALEVLGVPVVGYVSVEKESTAQRVVSAHFPGVLHYDDITKLTFEDVQSWARTHSQCGMVVIGAGPPCQGVSGLNSDRRGALKDARSCLFTFVKEVRQWVRRAFPWCPSYCLMESVASMDAKDREAMSSSYEGDPWVVDAGETTWCRRPRLYWVDWEIVEDEFTWIDYNQQGVGQLHFTACQSLEEVLRSGWSKVDESSSFPTFTTSRPSQVPGRKPAGIKDCSLEELKRWSDDLHRFPPYQYKTINSVQNKKGVMRIVDIAERECMMGFPVGYTQSCLPKQKRNSVEWMDARLTLVGNSWSVPVVSFLLQQLMSRLGVISPLSPQQIIDRCTPGGVSTVQGRLFRLPLNPTRTVGEDASEALACKLGNLISVKGEDIMLTTPQDQMFKFHRVRATIPSRMWKWRIVAGWRWRSQSEHINALEMRSIMTTLRWRIEHQQLAGARFLHLTDSGFVPNSAMPKRKIVEATGAQERAKQRKELGTLRALTVQPATRKRYAAATDRFLLFLKHENKVLPTQKHLLDPLVCDYLEHLWATGEGRALASDTVAGLQDMQPNLRHCLPGSWRLLKTWATNEIPSRAPPLPEHLVHAMAGWGFFKGHNAFATSLLLGFYTMLRSGEIIALSNSHVTANPREKQVLVSLGFTKGGKRQGAAESVILGNQEVWLGCVAGKMGWVDSPGDNACVFYHRSFLSSVWDSGGAGGQTEHDVMSCLIGYVS